MPVCWLHRVWYLQLKFVTFAGSCYEVTSVPLKLSVFLQKVRSSQHQTGMNYIVCWILCIY